MTGLSGLLVLWAVVGTWWVALIPSLALAFLPFTYFSRQRVQRLSRLRWNPRAGQDLFIVLNQGFDATGTFSGLESDRSQFSVKYTHTFRL